MTHQSPTPRLADLPLFEANIHIYRPNAEQEALDRPAELGDAEVLSGLSVDLSRIWA